MFSVIARRITNAVDWWFGTTVVACRLRMNPSQVSNAIVSALLGSQWKVWASLKENGGAGDDSYQIRIANRPRDGRGYFIFDGVISREAGGSRLVGRFRVPWSERFGKFGLLFLLPAVVCVLGLIVALSPVLRRR